jgi:hypothetical protein
MISPYYCFRQTNLPSLSVFFTRTTAAFPAATQDASDLNPGTFVMATESPLLKDPAYKNNTNT